MNVIACCHNLFPFSLILFCVMLFIVAVYAKEPQKTDPGMLSSSFEKINRAHHLQNCHRKEFQPVVDTTYDPLGENFKKKQHFISKQVPESYIIIHIIT